MKKFVQVSAAVAAMFTMAGAASAAVFNDTIGDNFDGNAHMDIKSVEVTNTLTDITFKITTNGSIANPTDWGKYMIGIESVAGGDTGNPVGNPWGRNIRIASGMDAWVGSWVDGGGGGAQPFTFNGSWTQNGQFVPVLGADSTTITVPLASLNLIPGQGISFDVYSGGGGGGDSANDALGNPGQTISDWQVPYDSGTQLLSYTLSVPEPASMGFIGLGALSLIARRRRA
ncbi:MAG: PEP-CTERM sorting domain-containing protein [Anaerolineae bacterium]|nr:PEP-CTERM sorting domain-containing protein [Phycisphaerae bacterium]